jgi:large subunit ribosomal protein L30
MSKKSIRITWVKSDIGSNRRQRSTLRGLGLRRLHQSVEIPDEPAMRGMVEKVRHLIEIEE